MVNEKISEITLEVLVNIRDEIKGLREDTNRRFEQMDKRFVQMDKRFEQMDKRFERMGEDIAQIRHDMKHLLTRFDRDYLLLASDLDMVKKRLRVCEQNLGIQN